MGLEAKALAFGHGHRPLFEGLSFGLAAGQALLVEGANGSGKTSLLRLLAGLSRPHQGEILWRGRPLSAQLDAWRQGLVYIAHAPALKDDLLAWENLSLTINLSGARRQPFAQAEAVAALARIGLARQALLPVRALSQGQRKRVSLARLFVDPEPAAAVPAAAQILLLDEPFDALDDAGILSLKDRLAHLVLQGARLVYTTHQAQTLALAPQQFLRLRLAA
ncbi:heme ABC exporter ATP-binding protein CcmA [Paucibacter sp. TC2R-5]|uniref:heme ABC exporter ATP-binding protein CcmA n=1 Tax=Paucibacter sp. TC2R-5 TaxID=2893555 RepID=UPI0021E494C2|nr:heme ABC exporter ATP-binding protein CcmA [Paucibacter sp. TC2R-5]MCV2361279.1 heme ABC exporter ATP-binding protein CcmA [Paucibacter sp. TC2R-5]